MKYYSPNEAAKVFGVSRMTVVRWIASGKLIAKTRRQGFSVRHLISADEVARCAAELVRRHEKGNHNVE